MLCIFRKVFHRIISTVFKVKMANYLTITRSMSSEKVAVRREIFKTVAEKEVCIKVNQISFFLVCVTVQLLRLN